MNGLRFPPEPSRESVDFGGKEKKKVGGVFLNGLPKVGFKPGGGSLERKLSRKLRKKKTDLKKV